MLRVLKKLLPLVPVELPFVRVNASIRVARRSLTASVCSVPSVRLFMLRRIMHQPTVHRSIARRSTVPSGDPGAIRQDARRMLGSWNGTITRVMGVLPSPRFLYYGWVRAELVARLDKVGKLVNQFYSHPPFRMPRTTLTAKRLTRAMDLRPPLL